jgi:hypothetical protein
LAQSAPLARRGRLIRMVVVRRSARGARFVIAPTGLTLDGDHWGCRLALETLRVDDARVVDLARERALAPARKEKGSEFPGYLAGFFWLQNGKRALLYLTDPHGVVYVPTTRGYSLILSVTDAPGFIAALRRMTSSAVPREPHPASV